MCIRDSLVLAHPIFGKPFVLRTDASNTGVGAVLSQVNDSGEEKVVSFASKMLDKAQRNYTTSEKECYAIVYALEKFREYLDGHEFVLQTDNKALIYLDSRKNSNQRLMRWSWKLQEWSPFIQYIKGRDNVVADFLSRNSIPDETVVDQDAEYMYPPVYRCNLALTYNLDRDTIRKHQNSSKEEMLKNYASTNYQILNDITYKLTGHKTLPVIPTSLVP